MVDHSSVVFSEKIAEYRKKTGATADKVSLWMGLSRPTFIKREETKALVPTEAVLANLELKTGIPASIWTDEAAALPENLTPAKSKRGRKPKENTPTAIAEQRILASRINQVITEYYAGNKRAFANTIFIDEARLSRMLFNKNEITPNIIHQINRYTGVSVNWLQTGDGAIMDKDRPAEPEIIPEHDGQQLVAYLRSHNISYTTLQRALGLGSLTSVTGKKGYTHTKEIRPDTKHRIAQALKVPVTDIFTSFTSFLDAWKKLPIRIPMPGNFPPQFPEIYIPPYFDEYKLVKVPRLPEYARAGLDAEQYFEKPLETVLVRRNDLPINLRDRKWWAINVHGDSMEPQLTSGDDVYAYWLKPDEWDNFHNRVIIVQYANQIVIKRIKANKLRAEKGLILHSDNLEAESFFVPIEDIQHIWVAFKRIGSIH